MRNQLKEMGFPSREAKLKASVTPEEKKSSSQRLKRSSHGLWMVGWKRDSEMNHQGDDAGALVWSNETER